MAATKTGGVIRRRLKYVFHGTVAIVVLSLIGAAGAGQAGTCHGKWHVVAKAPLSASTVAVAALSTNDVWVVGDRIEQWNGTSWKIFAKPPGVLRAISALSSTDIWAVGSSPSHAPLIVHWDGQRWRNVESHVVGRLIEGDGLESLAPFSSRDIWAAGSADGQFLAEHWNGDRWRPVPMRIQHLDRSAYSDFFHGTAVLEGTPWFVGEQTAGQATWSLVRRGTSRTRASDYYISDRLPILDCGDMRNDDALYDIAAVPGSHELWAVGWNQCQALIEHWTGRRWQHAGVTDGSVFFAVEAFAHDDVWAAGDRITHYDGRRWERVFALPNTQFTGLSRAASGDLWAVGGFNHSGYVSNPSGRLIAHYQCG